ncbi:hypothetical protein [Butyrivibrio sp. VCD2006]|uniref:hypothetical protein n=1 Tax=Butyrivibrio sp. VCD2006 TaxID=1280664 RepID=UPI000424B3B8|nr:hypothetical protein [Butyrivibrio sp. VCD2006]
MHLETERLNTGFAQIHGAIDSRKLKDSREYYALAVLKSLFPYEYKDLMRKKTDRPDLKSLEGSYGIEVTTADSENDNEDNRLLSEYAVSHDEKIKKKLETHKNNVEVVDIGVRAIRGGGYNDSYDISTETTMGKGAQLEYQLLINSIRKKVVSANKYKDGFHHLELVIIKKERVPGDWEQGIIQCIKIVMEREAGILRKIYFLYGNKCYMVSLDGREEVIIIEHRDKLQLLARLTAEGIIADDDYEWQD